MTASSSLASTDTQTLVNEFRMAQERLIEAQCAHAHALQNCNHAKRTLDLARAKMLVRGVEGKNEAVREAQIRLGLEAPHEAVADAEDELNEARCNLEATRTEWDGLRYTLRCLELNSTWKM